MESDRLMKILIEMSKFIGLRPDESRPKSRRVAMICFYLVLLSTNMLLKMMLIPEIENVQDVMNIFKHLPLGILLVVHYLNLLFKANEVQLLFEALNELYANLNTKPEIKFRDLPKVYQLQVVFNSLTIPIFIVGGTIGSALTKELGNVYWTPESWKGSDITFWFYFVYERFSFVFITPFVIYLQLFISLLLIHLGNVFRVYSLCLQSMIQKSDLISIINNREAFKRLES